MSLRGLAQINGIANANSRLLDLVFVNDDGLTKSTISEATEPLIAIDACHPALEVTVDLPTPVLFEQSLDLGSYDFSRADYTFLSRAITQINWRTLELDTNIDDAVENFCCSLNNAISECVPLRRPHQKPPWSNARLRKLKRLRSSALRRYTNDRNSYTKTIFTRASNDHRNYSRFLYNRYVIRTQNNLRRNPKQFWSFVNSKRKEDGLPSTMFLDEQFVNTVPEKCNLFANHFKRAFNTVTAEASQVEEAIRDTPRDVVSCNIFIVTEDVVASAIRKLKHSFAIGPDGIPSSVLKRCSDALLAPLAHLFNLSLRQRQFPTKWKSSYMFPIHKKGNKSNVANYRGITSLCACSKVLEIIINDTLLASCKNHISCDQHGFFPKRSVTTNLVQFVSLCLRSMDSGAQMDVVYTDFKAAFDRVDHNILLARLEKLGVSVALVDWLRSYLKNRTMCIKIGSSHSAPFSNSSGVPQGSNLGPLLFSIFVNDISSLLTAGCRFFFADDVKICMVVRSLLDCLELQCLLDAFGNWSTRNFMTLSIEKCNVITFTRKQNPIDYEYSISGHILDRVFHIKDLGVNLDSELTFRMHYNDIVRRANRQLGFMFKIAEGFRDPLCLRSLYCSLVRSILESSSVVWCPYQTNWVVRIESVQRKFVRYALRNLPWSDPWNLPRYEDRCRLLGIETLEKRREVAQSVFVAKVMMDEIDAPAILAQFNMYAPERALRQRSFLQLESRNGEYGLHDPIRFMANRFNAVYVYFDFNISTTIFRNRLLSLRER